MMLHVFQGLMTSLRKNLREQARVMCELDKTDHAFDKSVQPYRKTCRRSPNADGGPIPYGARDAD
ncbi:hypothetical protein N825_06285 [Skermanella stibiiresistens SB22]|uniref:Uncharacterized protein n=1 Tax=Skermanella stibiiresistens SB22 TaxID=1385369 RepID=W9H3W6_9PROT|nr:hypothetical protein N825_06285 [Skermanella stibiiresistens SB22]